MSRKKSFHPLRQRKTYAGRDWPPQASYFHRSLDSVFIAKIMAQARLSSLGHDPDRVVIRPIFNFDDGTRYGLVWTGRKPHPHTGVTSSISLLVDWATLELLE